MGVGTLEEIIDDKHAIVSSSTGPDYYVPIMSFVDQDLIGKFFVFFSWGSFL